MEIDKKAKQILFKTYWSRSGWNEEVKTSSDDFDYAKSMGIMFDPVEYSHQDLVKSIIDKFKRVDKKQISNSFVASLTKRDLRYRSFLSSYAVSGKLEEHPYTVTNGSSCDVCRVYYEDQKEYDLNVLNFEKLKWGGIRLLQLEYINFDLEQMLGVEFLTPTESDFELLNKVKEIILTSSEEDGPRQLEKRLDKVFKANADEREVVLNIFGICGILETENQKGFFNKFINSSERIFGPEGKTDWAFPLDWWSGKYGINEEAWNFYFGQ